jgi:hypothetical protein
MQAIVLGFAVMAVEHFDEQSVVGFIDLHFDRLLCAAEVVQGQE